MSPQPDVGLDAEVLRAVGCGIVVLDGSGIVVSANPEAVRLLGWTEQQLRGLPAFDTFYCEALTLSPHPGKPASPRLLQPLRDGLRATAEADVFTRDDATLLTVSWSSDAVTFDLGALDVSLQDGAPFRGVVVAFADVTDRQARAVVDAAEREQDRVSLWRSQRTVQDLGWISELTRVMSATLDEKEALRRLARLLVPRLGDVAVVDQISDDGELDRVGGAVAATSDIDLDEILGRPELAHQGHGDPATRATIDTSSVIRLDAQQMASPDVLGEASRLLLTAVGARSMLVIPLGTRGQLIGVAALIRVSDDPFDDREMLLAADIGRRAGLVLDNARLYGRAARAAADLQTALLPVVRDSEHVTVAARYLPARDRYRVGGDWYDLFVCPATGATIMIIGDVAGHDLVAATLMAAIRNMLRGVAIASGAGPAATLSTVDQGLQPLGVSGTATAAVFAATRTDDGWSLVWSSAGHLPAILIEPGTGARLLEERSDTLLGTRYIPTRHDHDVHVAHGTTVLLYTDGLIERRGEHLDRSLTRLRDAVRSHTGSDPDDLLDALVQSMPRSDEDDTALLAVRLD